jgi:hypothetical protein
MLHDGTGRLHSVCGEFSPITPAILSAFPNKLSQSSGDIARYIAASALTLSVKIAYPGAVRRFGRTQP